jgi:hypothetical protein
MQYFTYHYLTVNIDHFMLFIAIYYIARIFYGKYSMLGLKIFNLTFKIVNKKIPPLCNNIPFWTILKSPEIKKKLNSMPKTFQESPLLA